MMCFRFLLIEHLLLMCKHRRRACVVVLYVFPAIACVFIVSLTQVSVDVSVPNSPICHSVEMDVHLSQSELSCPSFLSFPDSYGPVRDSPSSVRIQLNMHKCLPVNASLISCSSGLYSYWTVRRLTPVSWIFGPYLV